jgi:hypothetical protein
VAPIIAVHVFVDVQPYQFDPAVTAVLKKTSATVQDAGLDEPE